MIHWSQQVAATKLSCLDQAKLSLLTRLVKPEEHYSVYSDTQTAKLSLRLDKEGVSELFAHQANLKLSWKIIIWPARASGRAAASGENAGGG